MSKKYQIIFLLFIIIGTLTFNYLYTKEEYFYKGRNIPWLKGGFMNDLLVVDPLFQSNL